MSSRFRYSGEIEVRGERVVVTSEGWESFRHWALKLFMADRLLDAGFRASEIHLEHRVGRKRADIFADGDLGTVWIECGGFHERRLPGIRCGYTGRLIHLVPFETFEAQLRRAVEAQRETRRRVNWREVHRALVPENCALWGMELVRTMPRVLMGVARGYGDTFVFLSGWSARSRLHPRRADPVINVNTRSGIQRALFAP